MSDKQKLKLKIDSIDFALVEINLYLDTHPGCVTAATRYKALLAEREKAIAEYNEKYGKYIVCATDAAGSTPWQWVNNPWPWEKEVNGNVEI